MKTIKVRIRKLKTIKTTRVSLNVRVNLGLELGLGLNLALRR